MINGCYERTILVLEIINNKKIGLYYKSNGYLIIVIGVNI